MLVPIWIEDLLFFFRLQDLDDSEFQMSKISMEISILKKKLAMYEGTD
jgi:hypothetical protein